jgi:hypothetical protein
MSGMKEITKEHARMYILLSVISAIITTVLYALNISYWTVGVLAIIVVMSLISISFMYIISIGIPSSVSSKLYKFGKNNPNKILTSTMFFFVLMTLFFIYISIFWPSDSSITITLLNDTAIVPLKPVFQILTVGAVIGVLGMLKKYFNGEYI